MLKLAILGTGGLGRETLWGALLMEDVEVVGFLTSETDQHGTQVAGAMVLGDEDWLEGHADVAVVCAIGDPRKRRAAVKRIAAQGSPFASVIHPSASVAEPSAIGVGSIVGARAVITTQVTLGAHVVIGVGAIVSHDAVLEDFATLSPAATLAGRTFVGEAAEVGPGATIGNDARVGRGAQVGANAVVLHEAAPNTVVVGSPAREIRRFGGDDLI